MDSAGGPIWKHGTQVASTAAGARYGIAPGATLVPGAITLGEASELDEGAANLVGDFMAGALYGTGPFGAMTDARRRVLDATYAEAIRDGQKNADIVNQSYGIGSFSNWELHSQHRGAADFYDALDARLPRISEALRQTGVSANEKTFYVTAAGNERDWDDRSLPQPGAAMALFYPQLRGLAFAAAALGGDGRIAAYSNRCGERNRYTGEFAWDEARDGRHYCLAAPGTVNVVNPDGNTVTVSGTSFAAPIVSGGLALLMEHFRGQMAPREIGLRMVNTADDSGVYADMETYGAGVLDLEAALSPVGQTSTGLPGAEAPTASTSISLPSAYGDVSARLGLAEIATFDEWNAPFWTPLGSFVGTTDGRPIRLSDLAGGPTSSSRSDPLHWRGLAWVPGEYAGLGDWSFAFAADPEGELHAGGFAYASMEGRLYTGLVFEQGSVMGGRGEGAFEGEALHGLVFGTYRRDWRPSEGVRLEASATLAGGGTEGDHGMLREARALYSAAKLTLSHEDEDRTNRVSLEQPLRAEAGTLSFRIPSGREPVGGEWLYSDVDVGVEPSARAVALAFGHERDLGERAKLGLEWRSTFDAGHVSGEARNEVGAVLRVRFQ